MKKIMVILLVVVAIAAVFSLTKNTIAKIALEKGIAAATGLEVTTRSVSLSLARSIARVSGIRIYNPAGYEDLVMANAPLIYIDFDLMDYIREKKLHFEKAKLHLEEFIVVRNTKGELNVNSISAVSEGKKQKRSRQAPKDDKEAPQLQIDVLELKIGRVLYRDYTQSPVSVQEFVLDLDERYENITDVKRLVQLIVTRALVDTAVSRLVNLDFSDYKQVLDSIKKDIIKGEDFSVDKIEEAAEEFKKIFKLPFED